MTTPAPGISTSLQVTVARRRSRALWAMSGRLGRVAQRIALSGKNRLDLSAETSPHVIPGTQPGIDTEVGS